MTIRGTTIRPHGLLDVLRRGNLGALALPLLLLAAGAIARARLTRKMLPFSWRGVTLAHPAGWAVAERSADPAEGDSVVLMDLLGPGRIKPRVTLRIAPVPAEAPDPDAPAANAPAAANAPVAAETPAPSSGSAGLANHLPLYYAMAEQQAQIGTFTATRVDSAFAFTPRAVPGRKGDIPVVMRAIDMVVLRGPDALSIQVAAPIEDFEAQRPTLESILASLRIDAAAAPAEAPAAADLDAGKNGAVGAVTVTGEIVDAESRVAIPGAIVLFLSPGTSVSDVNDDNLTQIAYTTGMADSTGHFVGNRPLARAAHYGVMVVADGYRWIGTDDGVDVGGDASERLDVGTIPLRHR
jgi:hypothetical protein